MEKKSKVAAVLVTFNRLEFLKEIILALKNQTHPPDEIIVVNNSSTDGTSHWLESQSDLRVITQGNLGSSGGQYTAYKSAYEKGYDWIWGMDDDVVPRKNCLEILLDNAKVGNIYNPLRFMPNGKVFLNDTLEINLTNPFKSYWKRLLSESDLNQKMIAADGTTFEGPFVHRSVIEKIGLPDKDFFIYGDDTEFMIRAKKAGVEIFINTDAEMDRKLEAPDPLKHFDWKLYYIVRNQMAQDVLHGSISVRMIRPWIYLVKWFFRVQNWSDRKTVIKSFRDGYFYKQSDLSVSEISE
jgi:rhamnopyranosyl-N-acetylglucosaminyl-diphospho-decaprenol beta-1,3/1,4-galactofuranosyltransferase